MTSVCLPFSLQRKCNIHPMWNKWAPISDVFLNFSRIVKLICCLWGGKCMYEQNKRWQRPFPRLPTGNNILFSDNLMTQCPALVFLLQLSCLLLCVLIFSGISILHFIFSVTLTLHLSNDCQKLRSWVYILICAAGFEALWVCLCRRLYTCTHAILICVVSWFHLQL